uniref:Plexin cytoplasmic RasGAP domain-containing protein n=1 Tax=Ciona savignyi TaxID=51511 RepID=H2YL96_CIOSA
MSYYIDRNELSLDAKIGIGVSGAVVGIIVFVIIGLFARNSKMHKANKNDFQKAMENMEMSVRADFRKAFAELSIDMSDLTADIGDYGIPCLDYRTYVTNLFFPSYRYHPCMKQPDTDCDIPTNLKQGLSQFLSLLSNHNFLAGFIHTLEEQKSFSNRDKGNVASLLTVVLHQKLDYYTVRFTLHVIFPIFLHYFSYISPLYFLYFSIIFPIFLHYISYISPLYFLYFSIIFPIFLHYISCISPLYFLYFSIIFPIFLHWIITQSKFYTFTPILTPSHQVKEKVMDAVYKRVLFSQRPTAEQLDLEWRHGRQGHLVLPTHGHMMEQGSRWRRLMTIQDYKGGNNATLALIPKQQELNGSQNLITTSKDLSSIMSNHSADTSALSPMLPEETATKHYHLVSYRESTINRDRHKHIADLYLLRLINMKGILQNYVDAVMQSILDRNTVPCPVKYFFHFLDEIATKHGITDPEVLHIWKTNSLLGRFWVTILKNPESVFDIEKPDTIASSMAVISQTFIDACSVTEHKPTKDSPINKQLYAKEIPTYKKMVQDYYKVIKEQNSVSDQDVNAYIAEISRKHPCEFDVNVALKELWGYVNKYYEEMNESLENDLNIPPTVMQRLQHTYSLIDIAVNGS